MQVQVNVKHIGKLFTKKEHRTKASASCGTPVRGKYTDQFDNVISEISDFRAVWRSMSSNHFAPYAPSVPAKRFTSSCDSSVASAI